MPRKQRFKPSRKPTFADGTVPLTPVAPPVVSTAPTNIPTDPPIKPVRGRDAVLDE